MQRYAMRFLAQHRPKTPQFGFGNEGARAAPQDPKLTPVQGIFSSEGNGDVSIKAPRAQQLAAAAAGQSSLSPHSPLSRLVRRVWDPEDRLKLQICGEEQSVECLDSLCAQCEGERKTHVVAGGVRLEGGRVDRQ